jgi:hypothetical protein
MSKGKSSKGELIGYRVVTQSLIVGSKVFDRGDIITLADAGKELDLVYDLKLVEPVYNEASSAVPPNKEGHRVMRSVIAFKKIG